MKKNTDHILLDFLNSIWYIEHEPYTDAFQDEEWVKEFCEKWNISKETFQNEEHLEGVVTLRNFCLKVLKQIKQENIKELINELNRELANFSATVSLKHKDSSILVSLETACTDGYKLKFNIFIDIINLLQDGRLTYLKRCENPQCGWFFFDDTKNHTRMFCGNRCASLIKVRKFRENRK